MVILTSHGKKLNHIVNATRKNLNNGQHGRQMWENSSMGKFN